MTHASLLGPDGFIAGACLPLTDRAFRYGMSVFETIAIRDAAPLLLDAHLTKLDESTRSATFLPPPDWAEHARRALGRPPVAEGVARIYVTAGDNAGDISRVALLFEDMPISKEPAFASATIVEFTPAVPFGKTGNYWPHFLARPASGEAILCRPDGLLLGGSMSNLFLVIDGKLVTPRAPVRRGVVRDWIAGLDTDLSRADLDRASAAFLTNSRMGMCLLTSIDGRPLAIDPICETLWQRYRAEVLRAR